MCVTFSLVSRNSLSISLVS